MGLAAAGIGLVVLTGPDKLIRSQLIAQVKARTGRDLVIAGPSSFRVWPALGLTMGDVALSAPPGMSSEPFVQMKELTVSVGLLGLLKREVTIERLHLLEPRFNLLVDEQGRTSWDFASLKQDDSAHQRVRVAQATPSERATANDALPVDLAPGSSATGTPGAGLGAHHQIKQLAISNVRIEKGTVIYADRRTGANETVSDIDLQLAMPRLDGPVDVTGRATWKAEALDLALQLAPARAVLERAPMKLAARIDGRPLTLRYDGTVALAPQLAIEGTGDVRGASLAHLLSFTGAAVPASGSNIPFDIHSTVRLSGDTTTLTGLRAKFDAAEATGDVAVTTGSARPVVKANLKVADLNLDRLLAALPSALPPTPPSAPRTPVQASPIPEPQPPPPAPPAPNDAPAAGQAAPQSIEDLLQREPQTPTGPQVRGFTQRLGLSDEPIDVSALSGVDADLTFDALRTRYGAVVIDRAQGSLQLADRVAKLTFRELQAFEGRANGFASIDGRVPVPSAGINIQIDGFSLLALARLAGMEAVAGSGRLGGRIAMAGQGVSPRALADSLAGESVLTLRGGNVTYASAGTRHEVSALNSDIAVSSLSGPLSAKGDFNWNGEKVAFDGTLATLAQLADSRPVALKARIEGRPVNLSYDGTIAYASALAANGTLALKTPSIRRLASWVGTALPDGPGFGPLDVTGKLALAEQRYALNEAKIALDGETATGDIAVDARAARPSITANLKLTGLDLNTYLADLGTTPAAGKKSATTAPPQPAKAPAPQVRGYTQRGGWSEEPYDLSALDAFDLDARLAMGRLRYKDIKVGPTQLHAVLKGKVLKSTFQDVQLYQGAGKGVIGVDATVPSSPKITADLSFSAVETLPLLKDAADLDWMSGKGNLTLAVAGQGRSQRELISKLTGKANLKFVDGAIVGVNIPGLFRNLGQGRLGGLSSSPSEKTDFSELSSSWNIASGVATNTDLTMLSPLLRVTGAGKVMLAERKVDYTLKPRLVSDLAGQGGNASRKGLEIPVRVHGSWEKPSFTPDLKGLLSDPDRALDAVKDIGKQLKGKNAEDLLKGLLGGDKAAPSGSPAEPTPQQDAPADPATAPPPKKPSKTEQILDQILRP